MKNEKKGTVHVSFLVMALVPMFFLWLIISIVSISKVKKVITEQAKNNLQTVVYSVTSAYYEMSNDDQFYFLEEDGEHFIMKGELCLNYDMDYIEELKKKTGVDISFFKENIRVMTTLKDEDGKYLTGTTVKNLVKKNVIDNGEEYFADNVYIGEIQCFSYYAPLYNPDDTIVGMVGISQPADAVNKNIVKVVAPMLTITIVLMIIAGTFVVVYSKNFVNVIEKTKNFLSKVAVGNLSCSISNEVLKREDELGDIGRSAVNMQRSLRELVEKDALTGLINRRYGEIAIGDVNTKSQQTGEKYCIAIGDIDFFKRVNDTYGHEVGDMVLKEVANVLEKHMTGKGYAIRWGGEEFLLIFRGIGEDAATFILESILEDIHETEIKIEHNTIKVTMTFGIIEKEDAMEADIALSKADEFLYYGKTNGRNRIVRSKDIG